MKKRIATTLAVALAAGATGTLRGMTLHFLVEDALLRLVPLNQWKSELSRLALKTGFLLCTEMKRAEKTSVCAASLQGAVIVTAFDKAIEDRLHQVARMGTPPGAVDENGL